MRPEEEITISRHVVKRQISNTLAVGAPKAMRTDESNRCVFIYLSIHQARKESESFPRGMDAIITDVLAKSHPGMSQFMETSPWHSLWVSSGGFGSFNFLTSEHFPTL